MTDYKIYLSGNFISTDQKLRVFNPYLNEVFATTYLADVNQLNLAIHDAVHVKDELAGLSVWKKERILNQIAEELDKNKVFHTEILVAESGKPYRYAESEVNRAIRAFIIAAEETKRTPREFLSIDWTPQGEKKEGLVRHFPIGIVAGISPFNFPLNLAVHKIAPAIAAGCPVILKPSSLTPLSTLALAKVLDRTELPKGSISILPMSRETAWKLVTDERINLLSFTGSPDVGWKMKAQAGKKKVVLELGGNAGVIITPSSDIEKAVVKCVAGGFSYSGQVCIHSQRIFIHNEIFDQFTDQFISETSKLKSGDPMDQCTDISVMIDEPNAIRVQEWIREAVENGASLLRGGKRTGQFVEPTLLTGVDPEMKVCREEVFGPVVILEPYSSFSEAVDRVNRSRFGLQSGVFTNLINEMNYAFEHLETGGVIINDVPTFRVDHMPYGGIKDSGLGREGVRYAMIEMMEPKLLIKNC